MKEIIKYQADDGTIFDREEDCVEYEELCFIMPLREKVKFYRKDNSEMREECLDTRLEKCYYFVVIDDSVIDSLSYKFDDYGIVNPWKQMKNTLPKEKGAYWYNENEEMWEEYTSVLKETIKKAKSFGIDVKEYL